MSGIQAGCLESLACDSGGEPYLAMWPWDGNASWASVSPHGRMGGDATETHI